MNVRKARRSRSLVAKSAKAAPSFPPPPRATVFHLVCLAAVVALASAAFAVFRVVTSSAPARGYTGLGLTFGVVATLLFLGVTAYTLRKRAGQEWIPGRLDLWLRLHAWLSFLGAALVVLHAGFHWDGGSGTVALLLLVGALVSGVGGMLVYRVVPAAVVAGPRNLATGATSSAIADLRARIEDEQAGRSEALKARVRRLAGAGAAGGVAAGGLPPGEAEVLARISRLFDEVAAQEARRKRQRRLHTTLRAWLFVHVPLAVAFVASIGYHAYDATDARFLLREPRPDDFASPESCLPCHQRQYDEWIVSPHAVAQSSPIMDLQNRLVVLKDRRDVAAGGRAIAGDVCVRCHAPTGYLGAPEDAEDVLADIATRAPASRFGISCVTCHQIDELHANAPDPNGLTLRNMENFRWRAGKTYVGPFGAAGESASVGNAAHRGRFGAHLTRPELCASCHTVVVANPASDSPTGTVKLQDTYSEWREGGAELNWSAEGFTCLHCHNRPLGAIAAEVRELARRRVPLAERLDHVRRRLDANELPRTDSLAAQPADGFDLPLEEGRRRFLHTFAGVDERMGDDVPYHAGHARHGENAAIRARAAANTQALMGIAAGLRIQAWPSSGTLVVDVGNLGTGHHMPAGFAFAREMWLEVATGPSSAGPWTVVVGGDGHGRELVGATPLPKSDPGLRNFQAVLFDSRTRRETVLQNEATGVLTGEGAVKAGFSDRVRYLLPGEVRAISIPLAGLDWDAGGRATHLRVRLRFRSLPPEFIAGARTATHGGGLAAHFAALGDAANAARARRLLDDLVVVDMTEDVIAR